MASACAIAYFDLGKIDAATWLPYALLTALVLAVLALAGAAFRPGGWPLLAGASILGLAAWAALSLTWSPVPSLARDEALLTAFYAAVFLVPVLALRGRFDRLAALTLVVAGPGFLALLTALKLRFGSSPLDHLFGGRLNYPVSYVNGDAAFFLISFWPAVVLASRRGGNFVGRALASAGAVVLLDAALMTQSKGGALGIVVSAVALFALSPLRLRLLPPSLFAAAFAAVGFGPLTDPYRTYGAAQVAASRHAGTTLVVSALVALAVGAAYALADQRIELAPQVRRLAALAAAAVVALSAIGGLSAFLVSVDRPGHFLVNKWHAFERPPGGDSAGTHFTSLGSNRYDFWRVAGQDFAHHPIAGIGSRGFIASYLQKRQSSEHPARAHSLPLETLAEDGLVGFALLLAGIGIPLALAARRLGASAGAAVFGGAIYFLAHAFVDWIWTIPAVALLFFVLLGIGASGDEEARVARAPRLALGLVAAALGLVLFAPTWLSALLTRRAEAASPSAATDALRWARRLDPLALAPYLAEYRLASSERERVRIGRKLVAKEPRWVTTHYLLGLAYAGAGERRTAQREFRHALRLDPSEPSLRAAYRATTRR